MRGLRRKPVKLKCREQTHDARRHAKRRLDEGVVFGRLGIGDALEATPDALRTPRSTRRDRAMRAIPFGLEITAAQHPSLPGETGDASCQRVSGRHDTNRRYFLSSTDVLQQLEGAGLV